MERKLMDDCKNVEQIEETEVTELLIYVHGQVRQNLKTFQKNRLRIGLYTARRASRKTRLF